MSECPCVNCVCMAVCRCKIYSNLTDDCALIRDYITTWRSDGPTLLKHTLLSSCGVYGYRIFIKNVLKPVEWEVDSDGIFINRNFAPLSV